MDQKKRFVLAMGLYAVLAVLIWLTMDSESFPVGVPLGKHDVTYVFVPLRKATLAVVGALAAFTILRWRIDQRRARKEEQGVEE
jgi:hypothetical protein